MFVDLDWPLNASILLSASAELLVFLDTSLSSLTMWNLQSYPTTVLSERMWYFRGVVNILWPLLHIFRGSRQESGPQPHDLRPWQLACLAAAAAMSRLYSRLCWSASCAGSLRSWNKDGLWSPNWCYWLQEIGYLQKFVKPSLKDNLKPWCNLKLQIA